MGCWNLTINAPANSHSCHDALICILLPKYPFAFYIYDPRDILFATLVSPRVPRSSPKSSMNFYACSLILCLIPCEKLVFLCVSFCVLWWCLYACVSPSFVDDQPRMSVFRASNWFLIVNFWNLLFISPIVYQNMIFFVYLCNLWCCAGLYFSVYLADKSQRGIF